MEIQRAYYAIIPANVRYDKDLTANAKLLYGEITALCNEKGYCWAKNQYFSELYGVSKVSISKWISQLIDSGYVKSEIVYKQGSKEIESRYLTIVNDPIKEKLNTPIKEKFKDNNTLINNTINKKNNSKVKTSERDVFLDDSQEMKLVKLFIKEMEKNSELFKQPANINNWCNDMRLILDIDLANKSKERVARCKIAQEAILHSCNKPYFSKNVRSISKLRGRFGEILDDLKETKSKQYPYNNNNTNQPQSKQQYIPIAENNLYGMGE